MKSRSIRQESVAHFTPTNQSAEASQRLPESANQSALSARDISETSLARKISFTLAGGLSGAVAGGLAFPMLATSVIYCRQQKNQSPSAIYMEMLTGVGTFHLLPRIGSAAFCVLGAFMGREDAMKQDAQMHGVGRELAIAFLPIGAKAGSYTLGAMIGATLLEPFDDFISPSVARCLFAVLTYQALRKTAESLRR